MSNPSPPENWSLTYEANPEPSDGVSRGDDWLRQFKLDSRERLEVEHHFGSINADDNGLHRVGSARCFVSTSAPTVLEVVDHDNTGGAGTAVLSANASNSSPAETVGHGRLWFDPTDGILHAYDTGWIPVTSTSMHRGHIAGLQLSFVSNTTISVAPGECRAGLPETDPSRINGSLAVAMTKRVDGTWVAGSGNGGCAAGVGLAAGCYHVFSLVKSSGFDIGFDTNVFAQNLLLDAAVIAAGYLDARRIGVVSVDSGGLIRNFTQSQDEFVLQQPAGFTSTGALVANGSALGFTFPADVIPTFATGGVLLLTLARFRVRVEFTGGANEVVIAGGSQAIPAIPAQPGSPLATFNATTDRAVVELWLNQSRQFVYRAANANTINVHAEVLGWVDTRGRGE